MNAIDRLFQELWSRQVPYVFFSKKKIWVDQSQQFRLENVPRIASLSLVLGGVYMGVFVIEVNGYHP